MIMTFVIYRKAITQVAITAINAIVECSKRGQEQYSTEQSSAVEEIDSIVSQYTSHLEEVQAKRRKLLDWEQTREEQEREEMATSSRSYCTTPGTTGVYEEEYKKSEEYRRVTQERV